MMPPLRTLKIANLAILSYNPRNLLEKRFQTRNRITYHDLQKKKIFLATQDHSLGSLIRGYSTGAGRAGFSSLFANRKKEGHSRHLPTTRASAVQRIAQKSASVPDSDRLVRIERLDLGQAAKIGLMMESSSRKISRSLSGLAKPFFNARALRLWF